MTIRPTGATRLRPVQQVVGKPWGREILWAQTESYTGKILHLHAGKRLSLQYHDEKLESQCLLTGRAVLVLEDDDGILQEIEMEQGKGYTIAPFRRHRLVAITDADVLEVSTPEVGTSFRIQDDYGRRDETPELRRVSLP
jgi:mannose-6-phosphate isomerase